LMWKALREFLVIYSILLLFYIVFLWLLAIITEEFSSLHFTFTFLSETGTWDLLYCGKYVSALTTKPTRFSYSISLHPSYVGFTKENCFDVCQHFAVEIFLQLLV
jgi:hypothetical protein